MLKARWVRLKKYNYYDDEVIEPKICVKLRELNEIIVYKIRCAIYTIEQKIKNASKADSSNNENDENSKEKKNLLEILESFWNNLSDKEHFLKVIAISLFIVFILCFILGYAVNIYSVSEKNNRFLKDAGAVCTKIMSSHGVGKAEKIDMKYGDNLYRITGLAFARQMDFNNDNTPELLVAYDDSGIYYVEVWGYDGKDFVNLYSDKANFDEENITSGSSIAIYHRNSKYYIGKLSDEEKGKMDLYSLHGKSFKESLSCDYDIVNDIYAVKNKINSTDFETIKLSFISSGRAEKTIEATSSHLEDFGTKNISEIENEKTEEQKKAEAYYRIIEKYNYKYGKASYKTSSKLSYADGLAVVKLIDFNADGNEELLLIYRYNKKVSGEDKEGSLILKEIPTYHMDVYNWNGKTAKLCYENDGLSTYQESDNNEIFYILQNDEDKTNICSNTYVYGENSQQVWRATSRIISMNEENIFEDSFTAVANCNYGYMTYSINGEKVYRKEFKSNGYVVPYFCDDESDYDNSEFTVTVLQSNSQSGSKIQSIVSDTQSSIKEINPDYKTD